MKKLKLPKLPEPIKQSLKPIGSMAIAITVLSFGCAAALWGLCNHLIAPNISFVDYITYLQALIGTMMLGIIIFWMSYLKMFISVIASTASMWLMYWHVRKQIGAEIGITEHLKDLFGGDNG